MRTATFLALLMLTSLTLCGPVLAAPPTQGDTVTISTSESWTDGTFDGEIVIKDGGTLHWSGDIMMEQDARIIVEEGGTLHLDACQHCHRNAASTLILYDGTAIAIDEDIADTTATMTIFFNIDVPENAYLNLTIDEVTTYEITGESATFDVDLTQAVNITVDHHYPFPLGITHIELFHSNAELMMMNAAELSQTGGFVFWNQATFSIENHGTFTMDQSTIMGANIHAMDLVPLKTQTYTEADQSM